MWYALVDDQIVFMTHRGSQKHHNLQRDHRVAGLVEQGRRYEQLRGVQFRGLARETIDEPPAWNWRPRSTASTPSTHRLNLRTRFAGAPSTPSPCWPPAPGTTANWAPWLW